MTKQFSLLICLFFANHCLADNSMIECQNALDDEAKPVTSFAACESVLDKAKAGDFEAYYQLGKYLITSEQNSERVRRGLFYLVLAADENHQKATEDLSHYVKTKMVDGKIPLRFSHYVSYVEKDWQLQGKKPDHHFVAYEKWLNQVEISQIEPEKLNGETLANIAIDFENGYFLGGNLDRALKLYELAAQKGSPVGQYRAGKLLYDSSQTKALAYYRKAAKNNYADAMLALGDHYGCIGQKDAAVQWYDKAINAGNEYALDEKQTLIDSGKPSQC